VHRRLNTRIYTEALLQVTFVIDVGEIESPILQHSFDDLEIQIGKTQLSRYEGWRQHIFTSRCEIDIKQMRVYFLHNKALFFLAGRIVKRVVHHFPQLVLKHFCLVHNPD
jgi:hypothetical protein